jgi:hypothetical protein
MYWRVPFCTFRIPAMHLGLLFRGSWPCPAAARPWSANRSHLHAARAWGRLCLARGRRFRPLPGGTLGIKYTEPEPGGEEDGDSEQAS